MSTPASAASRVRVHGAVGEHGVVRRHLSDAPLICFSDGALLPPRCVCSDLFADLSASLRAVPPPYEPLLAFSPTSQAYRRRRRSPRPKSASPLRIRTPLCSR